MTPLKRLILTTVAAAVALSTATVSVTAQETGTFGDIGIPWPTDKKYDYQLGDDAPLTEVLDDLEKAMQDAGGMFFISQQNKIKNNELPVSIPVGEREFGTFFLELVKAAGLAYRYNTANMKGANFDIPNPELSIYLELGGTEEERIDVGDLTLADIKAKLGVAYPVVVSKNESNGELFVRGPLGYPGYVLSQSKKIAPGSSTGSEKNVAATTKTDQPKKKEDKAPEEEIEVWVFPLRHAWARDIDLPIWLEREQSMMIPGVASILRDVFPAESDDDKGAGLAGTSAVARLGFLGAAATDSSSGGRRGANVGFSAASSGGSGSNTLLNLNRELLGSDQRVGGLRGSGLASNRIHAQRLANLNLATNNIIVVNEQNANQQRGFVDGDRRGIVPEGDKKTSVIRGDGKWQRTIFADPRNNSVIVADRKSQFRIYEKLINQLDRPRDLIEISVAIIDINVGTGLTWGVDYLSSGMTTINEAQSFFGGSFDSTAALDGLIDDGNALNSTAVEGRGLVASALLIGESSSLFARVQALEEENLAQVLSRPSVLSLDNGNAVIDDETTFHVKVAGNEEVDLFPIPVKTRLRVNPHIFENSKGEKRIRLDVFIKDGAIVGIAPDSDADGTRSNIPVVSESKVSTEAVLRPNQSLMVGGRYRDEQTDAEGRVPIIGRIPVLGMAFKDKVVQSRTLQRMFIITPKILGSVPPPSSIELPPPAQK